MNGNGDYKIKTLAIYKYLLDTDREHPITPPDIRDRIEKEYNIAADIRTICNDLNVIQIVDSRLQKERGCRGRYNRYWLEQEG